MEWKNSREDIHFGCKRPSKWLLLCNWGLALATHAYVSGQNYVSGLNYCMWPKLVATPLNNNSVWCGLNVALLVGLWLMCSICYVWSVMLNLSWLTCAWSVLCLLLTCTTVSVDLSCVCYRVRHCQKTHWNIIYTLSHWNTIFISTHCHIETQLLFSIHCHFIATYITTYSKTTDITHTMNMFIFQINASILCSRSFLLLSGSFGLSTETSSWFTNFAQLEGRT